MRTLTLISAIFLALSISAGSAWATTIGWTFTLSGEDNVTFDLPSGGTTIVASPTGYTSVSWLPATTVLGRNYITFYPSALGGGFSVNDDPFAYENYGPTDATAFAMNYEGPQLFNGDKFSPLFLSGVFHMTMDDLHGHVANETVTIAAITNTPIPAALPLFLSALGGLGLVGWRRRKAA